MCCNPVFTQCPHIHLYGNSPSIFYGHNPNPRNGNLGPYPALTLTISNQTKYNTLGIFCFLVAVKDFFFLIKFPLVSTKKKGHCKFLSHCGDIWHTYTGTNTPQGHCFHTAMLSLPYFRPAFIVKPTVLFPSVQSSGTCLYYAFYTPGQGKMQRDKWPGTLRGVFTSK